VRTLAQVTEATGFEVLEHLEAEAQVPAVAGLQAQGDLFIIPAGKATATHYERGSAVPAAGVAVIETIGGGHEHRLFAGQPGTAFWQPASGGGQDIGVLECTGPAYVLHPEHGAAGIAPGAYVLRRQREQADVERLVAD